MKQTVKKKTKTRVKRRKQKGKKRDDLPWDDRYSEAWKRGKIQPIAHARTDHKCCYCCRRKTGPTVGKKKLGEVHHACYRDGLGLVKEHEVDAIGVSLFPVCMPCHRKLHTKKLWVYDPEDLVFGSRNTDEAIALLIQGYNKLARGK